MRLMPGFALVALTSLAACRDDNGSGFVRTRVEPWDQESDQSEELARLMVQNDGIGQAILALLRVRRDDPVGSAFDDEIRRLTAMRCGNDETVYEQLKGVPIEQVYCLQYLDIVRSLNCGQMIMRDGSTCTGKAVGP